MKALSIKQPWAYLICNGFRDVENRDWSTAYRGQLLMHASKYTDDGSINSAKALMDRLGIPWPARATVPQVMALGAIVGVVEVVDCVTQSDSPWFVGEYGFVLRNPRIIQPIPYKGRLGLYDVPDGILDGVL